jgi:hypothetical protein
MPLPILCATITGASTCWSTAPVIIRSAPLRRCLLPSGGKSSISTSLALVEGDLLRAPPALLWAADHPEEISALLFLEVPVMLSDVLTQIIAYTPEAMKKGSMWRWLLPLAPGVPERLIVGNERAFLTWFYEGAAANPRTIEPPP